MVVWKDFEKALYGNNIVLGHNILGYDIYILGVWLRKMGVRISYENFIGELLDTNILAKAIAKGDKNPDNELLAWQMRYLHFRERGLKTNQKHLLQHYNIDFDEKKLHDALYDIEKNFEIFQKQIWELEI
jgi:hypothetical protein